MQRKAAGSIIQGTQAALHRLGFLQRLVLRLLQMSFALCGPLGRCSWPLRLAARLLLLASVIAVLHRSRSFLPLAVLLGLLLQDLEEVLVRLTCNLFLGRHL